MIRLGNKSEFSNCIELASVVPLTQVSDSLVFIVQVEMESHPLSPLLMQIDHKFEDKLLNLNKPVKLGGEGDDKQFIPVMEFSNSSTRCLKISCNSAIPPNIKKVFCYRSRLSKWHFPKRLQAGVTGYF